MHQACPGCDRASDLMPRHACEKRRRRPFLVALVIVVGLGLAAMLYDGPGAYWISDQLGGFFYVLAWTFLILWLFPTWPALRVSAGVLFATCCIEFMQLWCPPLLEAIRSTFLGHALLGSSFSWADLPWYFLGAATGLALATWLGYWSRTRAEDPGVPRRRQVREARPEDRADALELSEQAYRPLRKIYRPTAEAVVRKDRESSDHTRLVVEQDGEIVATVEYRLSGEAIHVRALAVAPESQGRGHARALMNALEAITQEQGRCSIRLYTIRESGNVSLFERMGYQVLSEAVATWCESDRLDCLNEVLMEKKFS